MEQKLAVIRIRGSVGIKSEVKDTLNMLRLYKRNYCSIVPNNKNYLGMLNLIKDYVAWGEINEPTTDLLIQKRGQEYTGREKDSKGIIKYNKYFVVNGKKLKKYFRLNSPKKGFERKGIKKAFNQGGALGYRGEKINELIVRMV